jgi:NADP-dependent 3-hydroxy acid dehydrogenase YdfG
MDRWRDRVVLVTGASMGIGEVTCKNLAKHGMKVVGCSRSEDKLKVERT